MSYAIEKDIPLGPSRKQQRSYPFDQMQVGDSFVVERTEGISKLCLCSRVNTSVQRQQKFDQRKYSWRSVTTGVRVWRVA